MNKQQLRDQVLAYLTKRSRDGFKSRELRRIFRIESEKEFQDLRDILHTFVDDGTLRWTKQRG